jgi:hypothetical protein
MIKKDDMEKAANTLSEKLEFNIGYYRRHGDIARSWHYLTLSLLIILSGVSPVLTGALAWLPDPPVYLKLITVAATSAAGIVIWIRAIGNFQEQWRTFYMSQIMLISLRRKYKFSRVLLGDDAEAKFNLIEKTISELDRYVEEESNQTFARLIKSLASTESEMHRATSSRSAAYDHERGR